MPAQRLNISLPYEVARDLKRAVPERKRSSFIAEAIKKNLPRKNLRKELIKSLKLNRKIYEEVARDWAALDTEGWPE